MPTFNEAKVKYLAKVFLNGSFLQSRLGSIPCEGRKILLYKRKNKTSILRASKSQSPLGLTPWQGGSISTLNAILIRANSGLTLKMDGENQDKMRRALFSLVVLSIQAH